MGIEFTLPVSLQEAAEILREAAHRTRCPIDTETPRQLRLHHWQFEAICHLFPDEFEPSQRTRVHLFDPLANLGYAQTWDFFIETCKMLGATSINEVVRDVTAVRADAAQNDEPNKQMMAPDMGGLTAQSEHPESSLVQNIRAQTVIMGQVAGGDISGAHSTTGGVPTRRQQRPAWWIIVGLIILEAIISFAINVSTDILPDSIKPYRWVAWPVLGVTVIILIFWSLKKASAE